MGEDVVARRSLLVAGLAASAALLAGRSASARVLRRGPRLRRLNLVNAHTGERFNDAYWEKGRYVPDALGELDWLLRDFHADAVREIDPSLLDLLAGLSNQLRLRAPLMILSGYRTLRTNRLLRHEGYGSAQHSMHLVGRAVDICCEGASLGALRHAAARMRAGGVGYYPDSGFVHLDTGPVRYW